MNEIPVVQYIFDSRSVLERYQLWFVPSIRCLRTGNSLSGVMFQKNLC